MSLQQFLAIKGELPRKVELAEWSEFHFLAIFRMVNFFMEKETIKVTADKMLALEKKVLDESYDPLQAEMLYRIDKFHGDPTATPRAFFFRLTAVVRKVGEYVKQNPSVITENIVNEIKDNPRLSWMLHNFRAVQTKGGAVVVEQNTLDTTTTQGKKVVGSDPQEKLMESMYIVADKFLLIAKMISKDDIKKMSGKEKVAALASLSFIFGVTSKFKPNTAIFTQINNYKSDKEDIEKALLAFAKK